MTFLHPWAIWLGLAAATVPITVHLLTRPRPMRMPLSTLRFVREVVRQRRNRSRLRDLLILVFRTAAILLLAAAIARPQWGSRPLTSDSVAGRAVRVVLLDVSQSMAATEGSIEVIQRARPRAADYLRYRPGLKVNLILAGAAPRAVFEQPSTNFGALRDELSAARVLPERIDVRRAIHLAARMLAPSSPEDKARRELVMVGDFQRSNWARADFSLLPAETKIQLESVAPERPPANLAITRATATVLSASKEDMQLEVDVTNDTPSERKTTVEVNLGEATYRLVGTCPPGRETTLTARLDRRGLGWQYGEARLVGIDDALSADNVRPLVVHIPPKPVYALITRQSATQRPSSSHFLQCALAPDKRLGEKASTTVLRLDPASLDHVALAPARMIVLDHPGRLDDEAVTLLAGLLRRGRPMLYVASKPVDAANLKRLAEAVGTGLRMPIEFTPPAPGQSRRDLFLTSVRGNQPPFRVFGDSLSAITGRLRFAGGLNSRQVEGGLTNDILASFNDSSAALVLTTSDAGTLAVLNADLGISNLPRTPVFVPLLDELIDRMLRQDRADNSVECGEPLVVSLPPEADVAAGLKVVGPAGTSPEAAVENQFGELVDQGATVVWHWESPNQPGAYRVERESQVVCSVPVVLPAEESRLESLPDEVLTERLSGGRDVRYRGVKTAVGRQDDSWVYFTVACLFCMFAEVMTLLVFKT
ncbi:MAG: BatA and WFA domain-containing protein [Pirellulales bacterium]|nr:BatA and WFA domain-containing protein [Pirellulales bacterium]